MLLPKSTPACYSQKKISVSLIFSGTGFNLKLANMKLAKLTEGHSVASDEDREIL